MREDLRLPLKINQKDNLACITNQSVYRESQFQKKCSAIIKAIFVPLQFGFGGGVIKVIVKTNIFGCTKQT